MKSQKFGDKISKQFDPNVGIDVWHFEEDK